MLRKTGEWEQGVNEHERQVNGLIKVWQNKAKITPHPHANRNTIYIPGDIRAGMGLPQTPAYSKETEWDWKYVHRPGLESWHYHHQAVYTWTVYSTWAQALHLSNRLMVLYSQDFGGWSQAAFIKLVKPRLAHVGSQWTRASQKFQIQDFMMLLTVVNWGDGEFELCSELSKTQRRERINCTFGSLNINVLIIFRCLNKLVWHEY